MAIKPDKVLTHNEELPSIKSHERLLTLSYDFDFYTICRFKTQTPKMPPTSCHLNFRC